jgi:amino acid transporter
MVTDGPRVITLGWIIVGFFALLVGMSLGEICSAYPTAGGLYYWSAKLARRNPARWAWFTGYFNLLGQIGVIASVDYALAIFINYFIRMSDDSWDLTTSKIFITYLLVLVAHGLLNTFKVSLVKILGDISVWWHVVGVAIIAGRTGRAWCRRRDQGPTAGAVGRRARAAARAGTRQGPPSGRCGSCDRS